MSFEASIHCGRLADLTQRIIQARNRPERHASLADELCAFFTEMTGFGPPDEQPIDVGGTQLKTGLALAPADASLCLRDATRTVRFIAGVHQTVQCLIQAGSPIHVLYAGTGPFAPFAVPVLSCFPLGQVRFTLIDIHSAALDCVHGLVERLHLQDGIRAYRGEDAAQYRHPANDPVHLAVVETMQNALNREPQVAIMRNLATQFTRTTRFIPACIFIRAVLLGNHPDIRRRAISMGSIFELSAGAFHKAKPTAPSPDCIPAGIVRVPETFCSDCKPLLATRIQVTPSIAIDEGACDLTQPAPFPDGQPFGPGDRLAFHYEIGAYPQFKYRVLSRGVHPCLPPPNTATTGSPGRR